MQRDTRKQEPYFSKWIEYDEQTSLERQARIDAGKLRPYGAVQAASRLFDVQVHRLVMRYSRGDDMNVLVGDLRSTLAARTQLKNLCDALPDDEQKLREMYERLSADSYPEYMWWLAFTVALGMDKSYIQQALELIDNTGQDGLLDRIAVALGDTDRSVVSGVLYKQHAPLLEALDGPEARRAAAVKKFLDGWYKGSRNVYWHGNDKGDDTGYMGYWAFEAALVVILFDIDDASFRDNVYYPRDLVTHARARTKQASAPPSPSIAPARVPAGQPCPRSGYWFTPAKADSRHHFKSGDVFPDIPDAAYGTVLWQWAPDQT